MSRHRTVNVACPQCSQAQEVTVWDSLNVQISPEGQAAFFEGKINVLECGACGHRAALAAPFLYHDMALRFCVQYYPPESIEDEVLLRHHTVEGTMAADVFGAAGQSRALEKADYMLRPHIVFSMREALTYVVFRENLAAFHGQADSHAEQIEQQQAE